MTRTTHNWTMIDRWDVDDDGAEDMIVTDGERTLLLVRRHVRGPADPATWCIAYDATGTSDIRTTLKESGEHVNCIPFTVLEWPATIVHNIANAAK